MNELDLELTYTNKCLNENPYNIVSEKITEAINEYHKILLTHDVKGVELTNIFIDLIKSKLPVNYTEFSKEEITELENNIYYIINKTLAEDDFVTFNFRIICIEDMIVNSMCLDQRSKERVLVYCAAIKSTISTILEITDQIKTKPWEECFKKKLAGMGVFESLACVIEWPICLGTKAADCLIDTLLK